MKLLTNLVESCRRLGLNSANDEFVVECCSGGVKDCADTLNRAFSGRYITRKSDSYSFARQPEFRTVVTAAGRVRLMREKGIGEQRGALERSTSE
jgi:hypothetical protein